MLNLDKFDLAGFCVGIVERDNLIPKINNILKGDVIIGLPSSGVHSNGFSLVFDIINKNQISLHEKIHFLEDLSLGECLLTPTTIYVDHVLELTNKKYIKAMAHITGGGIQDNLARVLPDNLSAIIDAKIWPMLPIFKYLQKLGNIEPSEMFKTFNCGIGMIIITDENKLKEISKYLKDKNYPYYKIGVISELSDIKVKLKNIDSIFE